MPSWTKEVLGVMHEVADFLFLTSARNKWDERVYRRGRRGSRFEGVECLARKGCDCIYQEDERRRGGGEEERRRGREEEEALDLERTVGLV